MDSSPASPTNRFSISGLTPLEAFAKIDAELIRLHSQIDFLKGLRNSLTPSSIIPNELLSKIFLYSHHADAEAGFADGHSRLAIGWVSRHWRSVALSCPRLWGSIYCYQFPYTASMGVRSMDYTLACLERSKDVDLSISLYNPHDNFLESCLRWTHRISNIEIKMSTIGRSSLYHLNRSSSLWGSPAPRLVSLLLEGFHFSSTHDTDEDLPLFSGIHPQFRHLTILECEFGHWRDLPLLSASGLATLRIHHPLASLPIDNIVTMLSLLPTLEICELVYCFPEAQQILSSRTTPLPLLNMTNFIVESEAHRAFGLLDRLHLPAASVCVRTESGTNSESWLRDALRLFKDCRARYLGGEDIRDISLESQYPLFVVTASTCSPAFPSAGSRPRQFTFSTPIYEPSQTDPIACAFDHLPLAHASLQSLFITGGSREIALYGLYRAPYLQAAKTRNSKELPESQRRSILNAVETLAKTHPPSTWLTSINTALSRKIPTRHYVDKTANISGIFPLSKTGTRFDQIIPS
ncbi:hypothetical protein BDN72DRAFT_849779 [Pluteus cervinus]|uniref:Uncharacterized protein n=1 Tax=Pluteus cervinus TaxID=181527 RepID=A0ACD3A6P0_9AGAR|nr:hypothetical protein BDN72DRAFT_849779 [Pluteus cervinus]